MQSSLSRAVLTMALLATAIAAGCAASSSGGRTLQPVPVAKRSSGVMAQDLDQVLAGDARYQQASMADDQVAELWRIAIDQERAGKYHIAAAAIQRMVELDGSIAESEVVLIKLAELHNAIVDRPLSVLREPPPVQRPTMIPPPSR